MAKQNKHQKIAQDIIAALKDGTAPWIKPWTPEQSASPYNPVSGTRYKGVNFIYLSMQGKLDPRWVTFNQAKKNGWQVKKGSKGTTVQFWQFEKEKKVTNEVGETVTQKVKLERPILRHYYVFNGSQIDGIPKLEAETTKTAEWERHERAENLLKQSGAEIQHVAGDKAAYSSSLDIIRMPQKGQFGTPDKYYAIALHELGHWTGHASRLDRPLSNVFGSQDYAREELRAEIASYMIGMQLGIGHDPGQHLAYVDSWIRDLEDHPTEIFKACADAEKIQSFVMDFEQEQKQEQIKEIAVEHDNPYYIVTDETLTGLAPDGQLNVAAWKKNESESMARFDDPAIALQAALAATKNNKDRLGNSDLYVYRVYPPDDLQDKPVLITGTPLQIHRMWDKNIGGEFPKNILNDAKTPENQPGESTGKRFISFWTTGNDPVIFQIQHQKTEHTLGVLRFENPLKKSLSEKPNLDDYTEKKYSEIIKNHLSEAKRNGHDGIIYAENGKPIEAIPIDGRQMFPGMYQATKRLKKNYLSVPYEDKDRANQLGALWDRPAKSWYIPEGLDSKPFSRWQRGQSVTGDNPQQQFAEFIRNMGGNLKGESPQMDGKGHRIPEIGAKLGNKNISYTGYLDGVPAGYVKNFHSGSEKRWKMTGEVLTNEDRVRLKKEGQQKKKQRAKEQQELYTTKAKESKGITDKLPLATGKEAYFVDKEINIDNPNVKINPRGNIIVPLLDIDGQQWSHLTLQRNGFKQIFKDSRLQANFALIGAKSVQDIKGDYNLVEGFSTGATIHEITGKPVIVCSTSNNLIHVATTLKDRQPNKEIIIMADDDRYLVDMGKVNSGQAMAEKAAKAVNAHVISPDFAGENQDKNKTDFNDMARIKGKDTVRNYIKVKMELAWWGKKAEQGQKREQKKKQDRETALVER